MMKIKDVTSEPVIEVGIMTAPSVTVTYHHGFGRLDGSTVTYDAGNLPLCVMAESGGVDSLFELHGVTIGIGFHWQRVENQRFVGSLKLIADACGRGVTAVNLVPLEAYLTSVISSEMAATSSIGLLRTHAIISRSWLLFQLCGDVPRESDAEDSPSRLIRWYDREAHTGFDVCADDHCQRYQGVTRQTSPLAAQAVAETRGEVLMYGDEVCDARFSKCCGGVTERFANCWQPVDKPYLQAAGDVPLREVAGDLTDEDEARRFITSSPPAWCNVTDPGVLSQVLNSYDRDTPDFYRWQVRYTPGELRVIIKERSGTDYGDIIAIEPVRRGQSGRIVELRITGTLHTRVIGKELEIRRTLSRSHLYSSAFVVDRADSGDWIFTGAGWGHGVGLCQIGAAVMAADGLSHREILARYFAGASVRRLY